MFNDAAVASRVLQCEGRAQRILIADCDVHQGNGTAAIFRDDPSVFTFSIHGARDRLVLETSRQRDVPVAAVMGGGYAHPIEDTVDIRCRTILMAAAMRTAPAPV